MKQGSLSEYFAGVAVKKLSAVEVDPSRSHQHEFNGVAQLKDIFGTAPGKIHLKAQFIYVNDDEEQFRPEFDEVTWYDARAEHPTRTEHRLYFKTAFIPQKANEGDTVFICRLKAPQNTTEVLVIIAAGGSNIENQLRWLFGIGPREDGNFAVRAELKTDRDRLGYASKLILESIGVLVEESDAGLLDLILKKFGIGFPDTRRFSEFARSTLDELDVVAAPDDALVALMEREELLFKTLEKHLVAEKLAIGFKDDVDEFLRFSLSVHNRRKSRAGFALENHLEHIFSKRGIRHKRGAATERKSTVDFLFPGLSEYADTKFDATRLTMLGAKSTCKDRWRQVLAEAARIKEKHLLTLEPAISEPQTDEMTRNNLRLVVPRKIQETYSASQQKTLIDLADFCETVLRKQA